MFNPFKKKSIKSTLKVDFQIDKEKPFYSGLMVKFQDEYNDSLEDLSKSIPDIKLPEINNKNVLEICRTAAQTMSLRIVSDSMDAFDKKYALNPTFQDASFGLAMQMTIVDIMSIYLHQENVIPDGETLFEDIASNIAFYVSFSKMDESDKSNVPSSALKFYKDIKESEVENVIKWNTAISKLIYKYFSLSFDITEEDENKLKEAFVILFKNIYQAY